VLIERFGGGLAGYQKMSFVYGAICLLTMLTPALSLRDASIAHPDKPHTRWFAAVRVVLSDPQYRRLLLVNLLQKIGEGIGYGSFVYFFLYWLDQPLSAVGACVLASTVAQIIAQPLWVAASRRYSRNTCCVASVISYMIMNALWLAVPARVFWPVPVVGFLVGFTAAGLMLTLVAMMSDVAVAQREAADTRFEGLISGIWLAAEKIGFAAGGMLVGLTLGAFGFVESSSGINAVQSHTTRIGIAVAYVGLGTLFYLITLALIIWMRKTNARTDAGPGHVAYPSDVSPCP
jgi:Na+/melibiose symporter-like transporter